MRFHVVALPHTQALKSYSSCAYTQKVIGFCNMMKARGHTVFLYAGEDTDADCDELVTCIDEPLRAEMVGPTRHYTETPFNSSDKGWMVFNYAAIAGIKARAEPHDFLCLIAGIAQKPIADALPELMAVEFGVGYSGTFTGKRVFESYAWMHMHYGATAQRENGSVAGVAGDGNWWDVVIPGYLDPSEFQFEPRKKGYFLYVGRAVDRKGFSIAREVCEKIAVPLYLAGPGDFGDGYGTKLGPLEPAERNMWMAGAQALFAPTRYIEPFGNVAIEAMACGTPVISTDWGAFTETVVPAVGWRCRTFGEFVNAAEIATYKVGQVRKPRGIRAYVENRYSLDVIGAQYERYFERLLTLWDKGWYQF